MIRDIAKKAAGLTAKSKRTIIIIIGLAGIVLIFISGFVPKSGEESGEIDASESPPVTADEYRRQLESELEDIISQIDGAGNVSILITMESSVEDVYAVEKNIEEKSSTSTGSDVGDSESEYKEENKYVTVKRRDGSEDTVLQKQIMPKIRGVLVVCDGGGNSVVKEKITQAVSGVLNISGGKVFVTN